MSHEERFERLFAACLTGLLAGRREHMSSSEATRLAMEHAKEAHVAMTTELDRMRKWQFDSPPPEPARFEGQQRARSFAR